MNKNKIINLVIVFLSIFIAFSISIYKRNSQLKEWEEKLNSYFAFNKIPSMSTLDAYYWLRYARDEITGESKKIKKDLRRYPDRVPYPHPIPLFSRILAKTYKLFSSEGFDHLYIGSIKVCNIFAGLFIIPLIIYIYLSGGYLSGLLASLIGTFSYAYYVRSSTGRVDTDGILMFSPFFIALLFLLIIKLRNIWIKYILTFIIALFFSFLFKFHIAIQATMLLYFIIFLIALLINKEKVYNITGLSFLYFLVCTPQKFFIGIKNVIFFIKSSYFLKTNSILSIQKTLETVGEAKHYSINFAMNYVFSNELFFIIGICGCIWFFIKNLKNSIFILPIFLIGIYGLFGSLRFTMFLGVFIGLGLGYLIVILINYLLKLGNKFSILNLNIISIVIIIISFFTIFKKFTGYYFIPSASCSTRIIEDIIKLKQKIPPNSVVFTWWDFGYIYEDIGRFITFIDGGIEDIERRLTVATGFLSDNQTKLHNLITYVSNNGFKKIRNIIIKKDKNEFAKILNNNQKIKNHNIYIIFTIDLLEKADAFDNYAFLTNYESQDFHFYQLPCLFMAKDKIICDNFNIDLYNGFITGKVKTPVDRIIFTENGHISKNLEFPEHHTNKYIVIIKTNKIFNVRLISKDALNTVLNKMYLLGIVDKKYFEEVFNDYPYIRVFKVKN